MVHTLSDPSLPNLILSYLLFLILWFTPPSSDHTLSLANTWHAHSTVTCMLNPRVNSIIPHQVCPGYIGPWALAVLLQLSSVAAPPIAPLVTPASLFVSSVAQLVTPVVVFLVPWAPAIAATVVVLMFTTPFFDIHR